MKITFRPNETITERYAIKWSGYAGFDNFYSIEILAQSIRARSNGFPERLEELWDSVKVVYRRHKP